MPKGGTGKPRAGLSGRKTRAHAEPPSDNRGWRIAYGLALTVVWCGVFIAVVLAYFAADLPSTEGLWRQERTQAVTILDTNG